MKIKILVFLSGILLFSIGCSDNNDLPKGEDDENVVYPIDVETTAFSLPEGCTWETLTSDSVYLINSQEELAQHLACWANVILDIDFSKQTLLLVNDISSSGISYSAVKKLMQLEHKYYELEIELKLNALSVITPWQVAIIFDKIDTASVVDLKVSYIF